MNNPAPHDLRAALSSFADWRIEHLTGDEKGDAQIFCDRLFQALGHGGVREAGAVLEARIKKEDNKGTAFADLMWKPRVLIEMKKAGTDLSRHYRQAFQYWMRAVPNRPRYVILCNFDEFWVYDFDNQLDVPVDVVALKDLAARSDALSFMLPIEQPPVFGNDLVAVTRGAAAAVASVFRSVHARGIDRLTAQRFVLQSVVAMFSEDIGLLPGKFFTRALEDAKNGAEAYDLLGALFTAMDTPGVTPGGRYAGTPYFNGGLFAVVAPIELTAEELGKMRTAASTDWSAVRPEIFGTLFETSMDASERHAYGSHFTSQADMAKIILPTIVTPWQDRIQAASTIGELEQILLDMSTYRVFDPACGSGNFLYVAYREMRRLEAEVILLIRDKRRSTDLAAQGALSLVTPDHFLGMDINPFAVAVAKVTMMLGKKLAADEFDDEQGVLPLDNLDKTIVVGDALFDPWPQVQAIVGNPPYLGRRRMAKELGLGYTQRLAKAFPTIGGVSDFVSYWFPLAHDALPDGGRAGLVATNAIRASSTRKVTLDYIVDHDGVICDAVSSQPWSGDAVVHVSIVNWVKGAKHAPAEKVLWLNNGQLRMTVPQIMASLKVSTDVNDAQLLPCNRQPKRCFQGQTTGVSDGYRLSTDQARALSAKDKGSALVIHPLLTGGPLLHELGLSTYVIDVPFDDHVEAEQQAPAAMSYLRQNVLPARQKAATDEAQRNKELFEQDPDAKPVTSYTDFLNRKWWKQWRRRDNLIAAVESLPRYIALTRTAAEGRKSVYQFVDPTVRPDDSVMAFAFADDYSFGVLSSQLHRDWFDERSPRMKVDPRYAPFVFESFPWPPHPNATAVADVAGIVKDILDLRLQYLGNSMTLAQQYDVLRQPGRSKLGGLHDALDLAVYNLYGFSSEDDTLAQLLALNLAVAKDPSLSRRPGGAELPGACTSTYKLTATHL